MASDNGFDISPIQEAAKWIMTAFSAVGAAIIGGVQFSGIGDLSGFALYIAFAGVVIGLIGVGVAIWHTSSVLVTRVVSVTSFVSDASAATFLNQYRDIYGRQYHSFQNFVNERERTWDRWNAPRPDGVSDTDWESQRKELKSKLESLEKTATRVAYAWRFEKVCQAFLKARRWMFLGAVLAISGTLLITYATGSKKEDVSTDNPTAVTVTFHLSPFGYRWLLERVGEDCAAQDGAAIMLDGWPSGSDLLLWTDQTKCSPVRIRWSDNLGTLEVMGNKSK